MVDLEQLNKIRSELPRNSEDAQMEFLNELSEPKCVGCLSCASVGRGPQSTSCAKCGTCTENVPALVCKAKHCLSIVCFACALVRLKHGDG